jgi:hypothetical protein
MLNVKDCCTDKMDCPAVLNCVNYDLYRIVQDRPYSLTYLCDAVCKCVNTQLYNISQGIPTCLEFFPAAVYKTLTDIPGYSTSGTIFLSSEDGTLIWQEGSGGVGDSYTNEMAQDAVGAMLFDTKTIDLTYNDFLARITADLIVGATDNTLTDFLMWDGDEVKIRTFQSIVDEITTEGDIVNNIFNNFCFSCFNTTSSDCIDIPTVHPTQITMTVGTGLSYAAGQTVIIYADATHYFTADVVSYNSGTGELTVDSVSNVGTGNFCNWSVNLASLFGLSIVITEDTASVDLSGNGTLADPLTADVKLSATPNNDLVILPDGLYHGSMQSELGYGGEVIYTGSGYIYDVGITVPGTGYYINGVFYEAPYTQITLDPSDPTYDRIDTVTVDTGGNVVVLTGNPAINPVPAPADLGTYLILTYILVVAGSTSPTQDECLYQDDTEWTTTFSANISSSAGPQYSGTEAIEAANSVAGNNVLLDRGSTLRPSIYTKLSFRLHPSSTLWGSNSFYIQWELAGSPIGNSVTIADGAYGFNHTIQAYQLVEVPTEDFGLTSADLADSLRITISPIVTGFDWFMDELCLLISPYTPPLVPSLLFNHALTRIGNTVQWGGNFLHDGGIDTDYFKAIFYTRRVQDYGYQFNSYQTWNNTTAITSLTNSATTTVRLGFNYTEHPWRLDTQGGFVPGYNGTGTTDADVLNGHIGYWLGVNGVGKIGDPQGRLLVEDLASKTTGVFFHTKDTTHTDAVTIYGMDNVGSGIGPAADNIYNKRIAIFHTDGKIEVPTLTQDDTVDEVMVWDPTTKKLFWRDANTLGASYTDEQAQDAVFTAITLNNGLTGSYNDGANTYTGILGGALNQNTTITTTGFNFSMSSVATGFHLNNTDKQVVLQTNDGTNSYFLTLGTTPVSTFQLYATNGTQSANLQIYPSGTLSYTANDVASSHILTVASNGVYLQGVSTDLILYLQTLPSSSTANVLYYDSVSGQVTYGAAGGGYTDEQAQDAVFTSALILNNGLTGSYNDGANTYTGKLGGTLLQDTTVNLDEFLIQIAGDGAALSAGVGIEIDDTTGVTTIGGVVTSIVNTYSGNLKIDSINSRMYYSSTSDADPFFDIDEINGLYRLGDIPALSSGGKLEIDALGQTALLTAGSTNILTIGDFVKVLSMNNDDTQSRVVVWNSVSELLEWRSAASLTGSSSRFGVVGEDDVTSADRAVDFGGTDSFLFDNILVLGVDGEFKVYGQSKSLVTGLAVDGAPYTETVAYFTTNATNNRKWLFDTNTNDGTGYIHLGDRVLGTTVIGVGAKSNSQRGISIGVASEATAVSGFDPVAIGSAATALHNDTVSIGAYSVASGNSSTALGAYAEAYKPSSIAIGTFGICHGEGAIAIGLSAEAGEGTGAGSGGDGAIAIGQEAISLHLYGIALGNFTQSNAQYGIAIGYSTVVDTTHTNSIVIGKSITSTAANQMILGQSGITDTRIRGAQASAPAFFYGELVTTGSLTKRTPAETLSDIGGITLTSLSATAPITYNTGTGNISTSMATARLIGRTTAGTGVMEEISVGAGLTLSAGSLVNSDLGSSQNIFKNVAASSGTTSVADSNNDTLTLSAGDATMTVTGNSATDTVSFVANPSAILTTFSLKSGNVIWVDKDSSHSTDTRGGLSNYDFAFPFNTIQAAVTVWTDGDTIIVLPGEYEETVTRSTISGAMKIIYINAKHAGDGPLTLNGNDDSVDTLDIYLINSTLQANSNACFTSAEGWLRLTINGNIKPDSNGECTSKLVGIAANGIQYTIVNGGTTLGVSNLSIIADGKAIVADSLSTTTINIKDSYLQGDEEAITLAINSILRFDNSTIICTSGSVPAISCADKPILKNIQIAGCYLESGDTQPVFSFSGDITNDPSTQGYIAGSRINSGTFVMSVVTSGDVDYGMYIYDNQIVVRDAVGYAFIFPDTNDTLSVLDLYRNRCTEPLLQTDPSSYSITIVNDITNIESDYTKAFKFF